MRVTLKENGRGVVHMCDTVSDIIIVKVKNKTQFETRTTTRTHWEYFNPTEDRYVILPK